MKKRQTSTNQSHSQAYDPDHVGSVCFMTNDKGEIYAKSDSDHPAVQKTIEFFLKGGGDGLASHLCGKGTVRVPAKSARFIDRMEDKDQ